jgi:hypothetical protein
MTNTVAVAARKYRAERGQWGTHGEALCAEVERLHDALGFQQRETARACQEYRELLNKTMQERRAPEPLPVLTTNSRRLSEMTLAELAALSVEELDARMNAAAFDLVSILNAQIGAAPPPEQWQPIATAPRHKPLLLWWMGCRVPAVGWYAVDETREGWRCEGDECIPKNQEACTHWMPLLPGPSQLPAGGGT